MVEHNLAKVGVASSNLVSRSILFLILSISFLFSKPIVISQNYCINDEEEIFSTFFDSNLSVFPVVKIPKTSSKFSLPSLHVNTAFKEHNITIIDKSTGVITFQRNCNLSGQKAILVEKIKDLYTENYPCISIENIDIQQRSPLPYNFDKYKILDASVNISSLQRDSGTLITLFKIPSTTNEKKIYFSYKIKANINAFKAKHNMSNDTILSQNDYEMIRVAVDNLPSKLISCKIEKNLISRNYVREGELLTYNKVEIKKDALKGSQIRAYMIDGSLVIGIDAILQEDANIGDKIKVRTKDNKILRAKLFSLTEAMILQ